MRMHRCTWSALASYIEIVLSALLAFSSQARVVHFSPLFPCWVRCTAYTPCVWRLVFPQLLYMAGNASRYALIRSAGAAPALTCVSTSWRAVCRACRNSWTAAGDSAVPWNELLMGTTGLPCSRTWKCATLFQDSRTSPFHVPSTVAVAWFAVLTQVPPSDR